MHFTRIFPPTIRLTFAVRYSSLKKKGINKFHGVSVKKENFSHTLVQIFRQIWHGCGKHGASASRHRGACHGGGEETAGSRKLRRERKDSGGEERRGEQLRGGARHHDPQQGYRNIFVSRRLIPRGGGISLPERLGLRFTEFVESARESSERIKSMSERWIF